MTDLLRIVLQFPTVVFTTLVAVAALYWLVVLLGFADWEAGDALDGVEAGDIAAGGEGDAAAEGPGGGGGRLAPIVRALGAGGVPITITASFAALWAWLLSSLAGGFLTDIGGLPGLAARTGSGLGALVAGLWLAGLTVRPLRPMFQTHGAARPADFVNRPCTVTTLRVTDDFGQAEIDDGGAGVLVQVRCPQPNPLGRGSRALVWDWDAARGVYHVAPAGATLVDPGQALAPEPPARPARNRDSNPQGG